MSTDRQISDALGAIGDASVHQLAEIAEAVINEIGHHGRQAAEALLARVKHTRDANFEEGLAQIEAVDGVVTGRTDNL